RIDLKVRGGQVIQQYVEADVEQIPPATHQMIKQRRLVLEQQIVAVIERVLVDDTVHAQQIRQRTASIPLTMQTPLAAGREQSIHRQNQQHLIPARPLATRRQTLRPELVQLQLAPQLQRQPASAPHCRARSSRRCESRSRTTDSSDS